MSESVVETVVGTVKARNASIPKATFVAAVAAGADLNQTAAEVAAELGMSKPSFDQRLNALRKEWRERVAAGEAEGPFPLKLRDGRADGGGGHQAESVVSILQKLQAVK